MLERGAKPPTCKHSCPRSRDCSVCRPRRLCQVDPAGRGSGDGCVKMSESHVNSCSDVPYCPGGWTKSDGTVHCTEATRRDPPPASVFCCDSTGTDGNGRKVGDGCDYVVDESATCAARPLVCSGAWVMPDRAVTCR